MVGWVACSSVLFPFLQSDAYFGGCPTLFGGEESDSVRCCASTLIVILDETASNILEVHYCSYVFQAYFKMKAPRHFQFLQINGERFLFHDHCLSLYKLCMGIIILNLCFSFLFPTFYIVLCAHYMHLSM